MSPARILVAFGAAATAAGVVTGVVAFVVTVLVAVLVHGAVPDASGYFAVATTLCLGGAAAILLGVLSGRLLAGRRGASTSRRGTATSRRDATTDCPDEGPEGA